MKHSLINSQDDEGVDILTLAEMADVTLPANTEKDSSAANIEEYRKKVREEVSLFPIVFRTSLRPGFTARIGQKGYSLVEHQYSFQAGIAGHYFCDPGYTGGLPNIMFFSDGEYVDVKIGPASGVLVEKWRRYTRGGGIQTGINRIEIKFEGLVFIGTSSNHHLIGDGADSSHFDTHYVAPDVKEKLHRLSQKYNSRTGKKLFYNDASLPWGGVLDINLNFAPPHHEHRNGRQIDIAATTTTLPNAYESIFIEELRKITQNYILEGSGSSRHYHVRF